MYKYVTNNVKRMQMIEKKVKEEERKKRDKGEMYKPIVFIDEMFRARNLCREYSLIPNEEIERRIKLISSLFGKVGKNPIVENGFQCNQGSNISIGDNFYCNMNCIIYDSCAVKIGDNVMIGPSVTICTATHPIKVSERIDNDSMELAFPITIGNNVWIGGGAFINPGVTIGDGAVIASGAVVTKDIPANTLAVGVPARVKKKINESH